MLLFWCIFLCKYILGILILAIIHGAMQAIIRSTMQAIINAIIHRDMQLTERLRISCYIKFMSL